MQSQEKLGVGVAVLVTLGLLGALAFTGPDADSIAVSTPAPAPGVVGSGETVQVITKGDAIDFAAYLRADTRTVVEFTADW